MNMAIYGETAPKITKAQKDQAKAQDALASRTAGMTSLWKQFGGASAAYSHTAAGSINTLKNAVDVLETTLGEKLLPVVTKVAAAFAKFVQQLMSGKGFGGEVARVVEDLAKAFWDVLKFLQPLLPLVGALVVAWGGYSAVMKIVEIVQAIANLSFIQSIALGYSMEGMLGALKVAWGLLNVTIMANPFVAIAVAIVALIAIFILLYKHVKWFRDLVNDVWKDIKVAFNAILGAVASVFDWIKGHWPLLVGILLGPIALAIVEIIQHWKTIEALPGKLLKLFKDIGGDLLNAITWPFREAVKVISHIPIVGGLISGHGAVGSAVHGAVHFIEHPFGLAAGGATPYSGAFVVGERGPELVTLPQGANVSSQQDLGKTNALLTELILAVRQNSQALIVDGRVLAQAVNRQGLLQQARS
jgi:hypothetical protein